MPAPIVVTINSKTYNIPILNEEMKNILKFIITKIHHNETGTRSKINKKEYNYIWLELNKLIYLVTKYKPITTSPSRQQ